MTAALDLEKDCLIFLHIPKAAGSSFRGVLVRQFNPLAIHIIRDPYDRSVEHFAGLAGLERASIRFIAGHMRFGIHDALDQPARYITLLRDPVDRIVSHYFFVKRTTDHRMHRAVVEGGMSLGAFARSGISAELENGQTRILAGDPGLEWMEPDPEPCPASALDAAKQNLEAHFLLAGLFEHYAESINVLNALLGWNLHLPDKKSGHSRPKVEDIDESDRTAILEQNALDVELYDWARTRYESLRNDLDREGRLHRSRPGASDWVDDRPWPRRLASHMMNRMRAAMKRN